MQKALLIVGLLILLVACGESEPMATQTPTQEALLESPVTRIAPHAYFNSECYEYSNTIRYGCTRAYGDSNTHGDTYTSSYGYANADQHAHAYGNTYTSSYSYANADPCRTHLDFPAAGLKTERVDLEAGLWTVEISITDNEDCGFGSCSETNFVVRVESVNGDSRELLANEIADEWTGSTDGPRG